MFLHKLRMTFVAALAVALGLSGCGESNVDTAQSLVAAQLVDPDAAKFRDVAETSSGLVCGQVNGKNRVGAYAGFSRFFVRFTQGEPFVKVFGENESPKQWIKVCGDGSTTCEGKFTKDSYPVNFDGSEIPRCFPGLEPTDPEVCSDPMKAGSAFDPSQLNTNVGTGIQTVCAHGGYCYLKSDMKLNDACDAPGAISTGMADEEYSGE